MQGNHVLGYTLNILYILEIEHVDKRKIVQKITQIFQKLHAEITAILAYKLLIP